LLGLHFNPEDGGDIILPPKHQLTFNGLNGLMTQKTELFIFHGNFKTPNMTTLNVLQNEEPPFPAIKKTWNHFYKKFYFYLKNSIFWKVTVWRILLPPSPVRRIDLASKQ
jgi:hypothetical protein